MGGFEHVSKPSKTVKLVEDRLSTGARFGGGRSRDGEAAPVSLFLTKRPAMRGG